MTSKTTEAPSASAHTPPHDPRPGHEHVPRLRLRRALWFSLASVGTGMVFAFFNAQLPLYLRDYGVSHQLIGPLTNERSFAGAIVTPLVGRLSDRTRTRFGKRRPFFLVGIPLMAAALVLLGLRPPFPIMLATVLVAGAFLYIALGPYQALMADITPVSQRGRVGGVMALAGMVGAVVVALLAAAFWDAHSEVVFFGTAGVLALTFALTFLRVREPASHFAPPEAEEPSEPESAPARLRLRDYLRDVLRYRQTGRYIGAMSLYWLAAGGATPFVTLFGTETLGLSAREANLLFLVLVLSTAGGTAVVGALADRVGKKLLLHAGVGLFVLAALLATLVQNVPQALPVMVLAGLGNAAPTALSVPLLSDLMPRKRAGEFIGLATFAWSVVQPLGSFLAGFLVDLNHSDRWAFGFAAVFMAASALAFFAVHADQPDRVEEPEAAPAPG